VTPPGAEIVYGRNAVREAQRGRRRVLRLWQQGDVSREELERLCGSPDHQGLVAEVEPYPYVDAAGLLRPEDALVVVLDQVQDPQNVGAICRSAEGAGATGVVVPEHGGAHVTPAVCRASAGAVEHLAIARVRNLADFLAAAKREGAWVYGAEAGADASYWEPDYSGRVVVVLGSEGKGVRPRVHSACDALVGLPLRGRLESLNVGAAAAVLLYEIVRQRTVP
jgi:23S rRNA (guanosine2251-2'-O)-methyltransferase